ncbi:phosphate permease [Mycena maculata]|uniref:Phosphate permease n=1 Tax=Mycena maculata TaxID=230809 RepID=A0AAD7N524_9AGAR|nr:phosphate permease [Mycena maculata]
MADADDTSIHTKSDDESVALNRLRVAALEEVDNAGFQLFHVKVCLVAGVGFFTDAYDIFAINIATTMLGYVYGHTPDRNCRPTLNQRQDLGLKIATPVGTLIGQLFFGWLADKVGRKRMYGVELIIMIVGTFAQATAGGGQAINILAMLIFWRFIVGLGVGGDYPLSATISSEFASTRIRGRMMTAVFAAQGWGNFAASLFATIIAIGFKSRISSDFSDTCTCDLSALQPVLCASPSTINHVDYAWRLLLGLGCVPAVIALYFRLTIPETPRFTMDIERNVMRAQRDIKGLAGAPTNDPYAMDRPADTPRATTQDFLSFFGKWENLRVLIGTSYSWFAIDVAFYTLNLNASVILEAIGFTSSVDVAQSLYFLGVGNLILSVAGLIPGYWICFYFIDRWGRRPIQLMGFIVLTVLFCIMGFAFNSLIKIISTTENGITQISVASTNGMRFFVALFCLANLFQNFGPNTTTFVIPGEVFPTRYRSTAHGISAASGKFGAIVAQIMFYKLVGNPVDTLGQGFLGHSFEILAAFMLTGALSTLLLPETMNKSLEALSGESQVGFMRPPPELIEMQNRHRML